MPITAVGPFVPVMENKEGNYPAARAMTSTGKFCERRKVSTMPVSGNLRSKPSRVRTMVELH
jgi:hypothetical protein